MAPVDRIYGAELSPYSVKVRSYYRYKGIPHQWLVRNAETMADYQKHAKIPIVPLVVRADAQAIEDSTPIIEALEAGIAVYQGKPLVNSVTGEDEVLERVLPLVARAGAAVVAISNDDSGIAEDPDVRFEVARKIVQRAADYGIPAADVVVDPLVMPIGAMGSAGQQVFTLVRRLREELRVNTTCGASNVSFGLPNRHAVTGTFLAMSISHGTVSYTHLTLPTNREV